MPGLDLECFRRDGQRIERDQDARLGIGIERENAALLDQRARHRFCEAALRESHLERVGTAFIAGLVARDQRENDVDARPRDARTDSGRLSGAVAGALLRQDQRKIRRAVTARAARGLSGASLRANVACASTTP